MSIDKNWFIEYTYDYWAFWEFKSLTFFELDCGPWSHFECPVNIPAVYRVGQAVPIQVRTGKGLYLNTNK